MGLRKCDVQERQSGLENNVPIKSLWFMKKQAWCTRILSDVGVTIFGPLVKVFEYWDGL